MDIKSKKAEAFQSESETLSRIRQLLENDGASQVDLRQGLATICDEYEKLIDEAKFLTKVSDKLESKLNATNEKLQSYNKELASEAELVKTQKDKILEKNKQLYQEKSELDFKNNKFQMTLIVLITILIVSTLVFIYLHFFATKLGANS